MSDAEDQQEQKTGGGDEHINSKSGPQRGLGVGLEGVRQWARSSRQTCRETVPGSTACCRAGQAALLGALAAS